MTDKFKEEKHYICSTCGCCYFNDKVAAILCCKTKL